MWYYSWPAHSRLARLTIAMQQYPIHETHPQHHHPTPTNMAKLDAPQVEPSLCALLAPILLNGALDNDQLWQTQIVPLLTSHFRCFKALVRQTASSGAKEATLSAHEICVKIDAIQQNLDRFAEKAPFTIYRVAELLLRPEESGYLVATLAQAQKWVTAVLRLLCVALSETRFAASSVADSAATEIPLGGISAAQYKQYKLPTNVTFVEIEWANKQTEVSREASSKKRKRVKDEQTTEITFAPEQLSHDDHKDTQADKQQYQLVSPSHIERKLEDSAIKQHKYCETQLMEYKTNKRLNEEVLF